MAAESKTAWTPGPWSVGEMHSGGIIDINHRLGSTPGAITLALAKVAARDSWRAEGEANARLIAAAPELVEALEPFAALLQDHNSDGPDSQPIFGINDATITRGHLRKARALLQQIRGESWPNN